MDQDKGLYQNGFFVLKNHVTRMTAVSMSMIALMFLFALISQLIGMNYEIRYRAIWTEESLLTKEWAFLIVGALLFCAVVFPFELGIRRWFYGVSVGKEWPLRYIFSMFDTPRMYRKALWLRCMLTAKLFGKGLAGGFVLSGQCVAGYIVRDAVCNMDPVYDWRFCSCVLSKFKILSGLLFMV